ncbi:uncharacterized protein TRIVIDRAFT_215870 [Trichoderma virens Gv29-8]|uniref:DUF1993 domain-containing protein n=1 Tax=Hypocrea virens (strain Gv29-8 / FGSC 10586) TaxID=413071 RepID=G9MPB5_HYPVG|nr:uncharacterized protein TRIVIDRAFT_215870 [Trichoderma virens Gv29-8]EHK23717.1 hypothetical protein TRIVIDRAFT_215870 [Trichoderma virens Gv29-8]
MSYSLYDASVPLAKSALNSLANILKLGEASPNAATLLAARIHDDMLPLVFQVKMVTDTSTKIVARLTGVEPHAWEGEVETFADCYARIEKAQEILAAADKDVINQRQNELVTVGMGSAGTFQMAGGSYINGYVLPNLFFHLSTAYNILRKEGVPLGKRSYLDSFIGQYISQ